MNMRAEKIKNQNKSNVLIDVYFSEKNEITKSEKAVIYFKDNEFHCVTELANNKTYIVQKVIIDSSYSLYPKTNLFINYGAVFCGSNFQPKIKSLKLFSLNDLLLGMKYDPKNHTFFTASPKTLADFFIFSAEKLCNHLKGNIVNSLYEENPIFICNCANQTDSISSILHLSAIGFREIECLDYLRSKNISDNEIYELNDFIAAIYAQQKRYIAPTFLDQFLTSAKLLNFFYYQDLKTPQKLNVKKILSLLNLSYATTEAQNYIKNIGDFL